MPEAASLGGGGFLQHSQSKEGDKPATGYVRTGLDGGVLVQGRQSTGFPFPRQAHTKHSDPRRRAGLTTGVPNTEAGTRGPWGAEREEGVRVACSSGELPVGGGGDNSPCAWSAITPAETAFKNSASAGWGTLEWGKETR